MNYEFYETYVFENRKEACAYEPRRQEQGLDGSYKCAQFPLQ